MEINLQAKPDTCRMQHDFVVIPHIVAYTVVDSVLRLEGLVVDQQRLKPRLSQPLSFVWRQRSRSCLLGAPDARAWLLP